MAKRCECGGENGTGAGRGAVGKGDVPQSWPVAEKESLQLQDGIVGALVEVKLLYKGPRAQASPFRVRGCSGCCIYKRREDRVLDLENKPKVTGVKIKIQDMGECKPAAPRPNDCR